MIVRPLIVALHQHVHMSYCWKLTDAVIIVVPCVTECVHVDEYKPVWLYDCLYDCLQICVYPQVDENELQMNIDDLEGSIWTWGGGRLQFGGVTWCAGDHPCPTGSLIVTCADKVVLTVVLTASLNLSLSP